MQEETRERKGHTQGADEHAAKPEYLPFREERDRTDDQADLQEGFASVKTVRLSSSQVAFPFQLLCLLADVLLVALVVLDFLHILLPQPHALGLVLRPPVRSLALAEQLFRMRAMA